MGIAKFHARAPSQSTIRYFTPGLFDYVNVTGDFHVGRRLFDTAVKQYETYGQDITSGLKYMFSEYGLDGLRLVHFVDGESVEVKVHRNHPLMMLSRRFIEQPQLVKDGSIDAIMSFCLKAVVELARSLGGRNGSQVRHRRRVGAVSATPRTSTRVRS